MQIREDRFDSGTRLHTFRAAPPKDLALLVSSDSQRIDGTTIPPSISIGTAELRRQPIFVAVLHDLAKRKLRKQDPERSRRPKVISQLTAGFAHDFENLLVT